MIVGARSQEAHLPWLRILLSSPTPLGPWWTGVPPDAGFLTGVGPKSVAMTKLRSRHCSFVEILHIRQSLFHRLFALERCVGVFLDGLGNRRVERRDRTRHGILDGG